MKFDAPCCDSFGNLEAARTRAASIFNR